MATPAQSQFDVIVIGGGAAGMMAAAIAGQRGRRVLIIEHYGVVGEKIRISGGGRCNFTNVNAGPENFLSRNPHFSRSALARYGARDFVALVERHGIRYHEKKLGQLFCDNSAQQIIAMLQAECAAGNVEWRQPCSVDDVVREGSRFVVMTPLGRFEADSLVVATGGLSVPKIGASPFGYRLAERFGLAVVPPRPALVPLALDPATLERFGSLAGVSVEAVVACNGGRFREDLLFTHRGLSGPAILQISSYWDGKAALTIDLLPDHGGTARLDRVRHSSIRFDNLLAERLPRRLADQWAAAIPDASRPIRELSDSRLRDLIAGLRSWEVRPSGTLGWNKAEVTLGGIDTAGLSSQTLQSKGVPGLFFIGEVVDVTGWLGGYNFQWAWSSAVAAGSVA
jgi:predicted Rossmann fold flavoprotein